jgi:hypothetical protein
MLELELLESSSERRKERGEKREESIHLERLLGF